MTRLDQLKVYVGKGGMLGLVEAKECIWEIERLEAACREKDEFRREIIAAHEAVCNQPDCSARGHYARTGEQLEQSKRALKTPNCECGHRWAWHYREMLEHPKPQPCAECSCRDYKQASESQADVHSAKRALRTAIEAQGEQFKLREKAEAEAEVERLTRELAQRPTQKYYDDYEIENVKLREALAVLQRNLQAIVEWPIHSHDYKWLVEHFKEIARTALKEVE